MTADQVTNTNKRALEDIFFTTMDPSPAKKRCTGCGLDSHIGSTKRNCHLHPEYVSETRAAEGNIFYEPRSQQGTTGKSEEGEKLLVFSCLCNYSQRFFSS